MRILAVFPQTLGYEFGVAVEDDIQGRREVAVMPCWMAADPMPSTEAWMPVVDRVVAYLDLDGECLDEIAPTVRMANAMHVPVEYRMLPAPPRPSVWRRVVDSVQGKIS